MPFKMTKTTRGPSEVDAGHNTNMLNAHSNWDRKSVLVGPILSLMMPQASRPIAEEKLKAATRPAPTLGDNPSELLYSGRKNGGTIR